MPGARNSRVRQKIGSEGARSASGMLRRTRTGRGSVGACVPGSPINRLASRRRPVNGSPRRSSPSGRAHSASEPLDPRIRPRCGVGSGLVATGKISRPSAVRATVVSHDGSGVRMRAHWGASFDAPAWTQIRRSGRAALIGSTAIWVAPLFSAVTRSQGRSPSRSMDATKNSGAPSSSTGSSRPA